MKSLYNIYEDGAINSTPGNTVGMGNPMLPTAEEPGTEPLVTAKCKKDKKKCKKVKEGLLDDIDNTLDNISNTDLGVLNFIDYLIANKASATTNINWEDDKLKKFYLQKISSDKKGTIIIDYTHKDFWEAAALSYIKITKDIPVNNIKIINCGNDTIVIKPFIADISKFNIEMYKDNKTVSGRLTMSYEESLLESIKLCTFKCNEFKVFNPSLKQLELNNKFKKSDCNSFDLSFCPNLEDIKGKMIDVSNVSLHAKFLKHLLYKSQIVSNSSKLNIGKGLAGISDI